MMPTTLRLRRVLGMRAFLPSSSPFAKFSLQIVSLLFFLHFSRPGVQDSKQLKGFSFVILPL